MQVKSCYCCGETKDVSLFNKNKSKQDGLATECKQCKRQYDKKYYKKNEQALKDSAAVWYKENAEKLRPMMRITSKKWAQENKDKRCRTEAHRRASKMLATPSWLSEQDKKDIATEYALSTWCSNVMGTAYHVDHIVPLKGKQVCGLHVPWNLQVIPAEQNISKGNRYVT